MRPVVVILFILALVAAAVAAYLAKQFIASQQAPVAQQESPAIPTGTEEVLVASRDINPGEILAGGDFKWERWPQSLIDARFILHSVAVTGADGKPQDPMEAFTGMIAKRQVMIGEPISQQMMIKEGDSSVAAANLAQGMRAISLAVSASTGVAGLILPNDRVDVVMTGNLRGITQLQGRTDLIGQFASETIIKDARVMAIDRKLTHDPKEGVGEDARTITLEVTPQEAERVLTASQVGQLTLSLRSMAKDQQYTKDQSYTMDVQASKAMASIVGAQFTQDQYDMPSEPTPAPTPAPAVRNDYNVKVNRGGTVAVQSFGN
jgi:pilus assembly protein CpaB